MVLDLVIIGLAITLEPLTLVAFILMLAAQKGTWKGLAFILGWLACLVVEHQWAINHATSQGSRTINVANGQRCHVVAKRGAVNMGGGGYKRGGGGNNNNKQ